MNLARSARTTAGCAKNRLACDLVGCRLAGLGRALRCVAFFGRGHWLIGLAGGRPAVGAVVAGGREVWRGAAVVVAPAIWDEMTAELARLRRMIAFDRQFAEMDAGNVEVFDISQAPV